MAYINFSSYLIPTHLACYLLQRVRQQFVFSISGEFILFLMLKFFYYLLTF